MRGEAQIRAAARDDQETANRNGNKKDWRREKLGTLLDKLQEEYAEFVIAIEDGDREGMRWEGSDLRWTVTMIQDHHGVLELEEEQDAGVEERIAQLEEALEELCKSFEVRMERAAKLVDEGELNDYWRGNCDALQVCLHKLAALKEKEE